MLSHCCWLCLASQFACIGQSVIAIQIVMYCSYIQLDIIIGQVRIHYHGAELTVICNTVQMIILSPRILCPVDLCETVQLSIKSWEGGIFGDIT